MHNKYPDNENDTKKRWLANHQKGFVFSIFLTLLPFALVYGKLLPRTFTILTISIAAIIQILLQVHYFLGVDGAQKERWNLISLIFTFLIMTIFIGGTLWVMFTLNYRMM
jgi:cytochrome o ubiquinol oxidase operon protein cyoD